ncbi:YceI family protein [Mangrovimonas spongiae]|uniref:YceI family protein n=1 Tax=Mangrovimonas spongiae TaxID=2494697 RepID=A0A428JX11_9FLAO|nr:YceI family protein [Mangrovimonas spongiae]RSK38673.1 YceI family protein [Mangrovimonas spongiae]
MKQKIIVLSLLSIVMFNCKTETKPENNSLLVANEEKPVLTKTLDGKIPIDLEKSVVNWQGSMLFSFGKHYGTVNFKEGFLEFDNGKIMGGHFTVAMNTIVNTDGDYNEDLISHLKNEDFFDVPQFPESQLEFLTFEYVNTNRLRIDTNLTIKGITKPITVYNVDFFPEESKLYTKFKIDRTDFGISYNTKSLAKVKNYAISDAVELEVELYLK